MSSMVIPHTRNRVAALRATLVVLLFLLVLPLYAQPAAPANLTASTDDKVVCLVWDTVANAANYRVYRKLMGGAYAALPGGLIAADPNALSAGFSDTTAANAVKYFYVVRALNAGGMESGDSNEVNATPPNAVGAAVKEVIQWDKVSVIRNMGAAMADPAVLGGMIRLDPVVVTPFGNGPYKTLNGAGAITIGYYVNTQAPGGMWVERGFRVAANIRSGGLAILPADRPFGSVAAKQGSFIRNLSGKNIGSVTNSVVLSTDTIDVANSDGGNAFPKKVPSADMKTITFSEGNNPPFSLAVGVGTTMLWSKIRYSAQPLPAPADKCVRFKGNAMEVPPPPPAPAPAPPAPAKKTSALPGAGSNSVMVHFDNASQTISVSPATVTIVEYADRSKITLAFTPEPVLGSTMSLNPMQILGPSPDVPGAYQLSSSAFLLNSITGELLSGVLSDILLCADSSVPGYDSVIQATLLLNEETGSTTSQFIDQLNDTNTFASKVGGAIVVTLRTNLLTLTANFTTSADSPTRLRFSPAANTATTIAGILNLPNAETTFGSLGAEADFTFTPDNGNAPFTLRTLLQSNGLFQLAGLPAASYTVHIKGTTTLAVNAAVSTTDSSIINFAMTLHGGDANNDNTIDIADFGIMVMAYGSDATVDGSGYNSLADFNGDGVVDIADLGVLVSNYGSQGDP